MINNYVVNIYNVLNEIYRGGAFSQIRLNEEIMKSPNNAALITKVVYGVIDNDLFLQNIINQLAVKKPKSQIVIILKIGIYMLKFLDVPKYAVVNNLVELTKDIGKKQVSGFVNSILKNSIEYSPRYSGDYVDTISIQTSYKRWFVEKILAQYGEELAEKILRFKNREDAHIRRSSLISAADFEDLMRRKRVDFTKSCTENGYCVSHSSVLNSGLPKKYYVSQSISSILVCDALAPEKNSVVLDVCAAPGGKSVYLSEKCKSIVACDLHEHRTKLIGKYMERMQCENVVASCKDATVFYSDLCENFDYVLLDVPCSGFGVAGSRPDIKLKRTYEDVVNLQGTQKKILDNCSRYVKKGGYIVYSTCTILAEENQDVVNNFLDNNKDFIPVDFSLSIEPRIKYGKFAQLIPALDGVDGFFIAKLQRV